MQPQVRDLQALIAEQQGALAPQQQLIDESINRTQQAGLAQEAGLAAQQKQAFGGIEQAAQNKGMFFSGFSPAEQANYTSTTYLPALAQLQNTIAESRANLLGKKADLNKSAFDVATGLRERDLATLADWNKMTAEQQFNASQADKDRAFRAQQSAMDRSAAASNRAADEANPVTPFVTQFGTWMKSQPKMASRQAQDKYINSLFEQQGIKDTAARQVVWNAINAEFKRVSNPTKDWTWKR